MAHWNDDGHDADADTDNATDRIRAISKQRLEQIKAETDELHAIEKQHAMRHHQLSAEADRLHRVLEVTSSGPKATMFADGPTRELASPAARPF